MLFTIHVSLFISTRSLIIRLNKYIFKTLMKDLSCFQIISTVMFFPSVSSHILFTLFIYLLSTFPLLLFALFGISTVFGVPIIAGLRRELVETTDRASNRIAHFVFAANVKRQSVFSLVDRLAVGANIELLQKENRNDE